MNKERATEIICSVFAGAGLSFSTDLSYPKLATVTHAFHSYAIKSDVKFAVSFFEGLGYDWSRPSLNFNISLDDQWLDEIPEGVYPLLNDFNCSSDLFKAYINTEFNSLSIIYKVENATDESRIVDATALMLKEFERTVRNDELEECRALCAIVECLNGEATDEAY